MDMVSNLSAFQFNVKTALGEFVDVLNQHPAPDQSFFCLKAIAERFAAVRCLCHSVFECDLDCINRDLEFRKNYWGALPVFIFPV